LRYASRQTDRQTDIHPDMLIAIPRIRSDGKANSNIKGRNMAA